MINSMALRFSKKAVLSEMTNSLNEFSITVQWYKRCFLNYQRFAATFPIDAKRKEPAGYVGNLS